MFIKIKYYTFVYNYKDLYILKDHTVSILLEWLLVKNKLVRTQTKKIFLYSSLLVHVKIFGGETGPASSIAPKMGKLKINARNVQADIQKDTKIHQGYRVTIAIKVKDR